ncbi:N-alpha-acetyltransferase 16, NatA auxiliary subunit [Strongyloides ratti]|uniref:N-alpha-acetyltransferase 16, NatA auxiliary subunit n=1 Tax=Strongyloides ratti TaxID=34506 RepID=A0A090LGW3_STRRB|nr:N-alpha-acetyltransferase 16, NatA auxiliary subunit [Strongyloides ratti]CEF66695.1 N-alpha-acetyltransferase 16, NatA auxiliary subunit [Strongyloides ratti]
MAPTLGQTSSQPLPSKELGIFRKIVKNFELRQYKNALRCAKQILEKQQYANHGETIAMKALILDNMGRYSESLDLAKKGVSSDIKSYLCWHVYGLVSKTHRKYDEAIKAFKMALRLDKDNHQVMRDLSMCQLQSRDYEGFRDTCYSLLSSKGMNKAVWMGYAVAHHLLGDYDMALKTLDLYQKSAQWSRTSEYEMSEFTFYENLIIQDSGNLEAALAHLETNSGILCDKLRYYQTRAKLLMGLGRMEEAEKACLILLNRNPEDKRSYQMIQKCRGIEDETSAPEEAVKIYKEMGEKYPKANLPKVYPIYFLTGEAFEKAVTPVIISYIRKGVPSLFKLLRHVYHEPSKVKFIEKFFTGKIPQFEENAKTAKLDGDNSCEEEAPDVLLWLYILAAQHYDYLNDFVNAILFSNKARAHTPTSLDALVTCARIHKHAGNITIAIDILIEATELDIGDRFLNTKCAKYMFHVGDIDGAGKMVSKFTRENECHEVYMDEMQCMWFQYCYARAAYRNGQFGESLKKLQQIESHFTQFYADQFDFHGYCMRKMTLPEYVRFLKMEDNIRDHEFFERAAILAMKIYLRMLDRPDDFKLSPEEKKLREKERQKKAEKENKNKGKEKKPTDNEILGGKNLDPDVLANPEDPLEEASRFAFSIINYHGKSVEAATLAFEVYLRKDKPLLMLQALKKAFDLNPNSGLLHIASLKFLKYYQNEFKSDGILKEAVDACVEKMFLEKDIEKFNESFNKRCSKSLEDMVTQIKANYLLGKKTSKECCDGLLELFEDGIDKISGVTFKACDQLLMDVCVGSVCGEVDEEFILKFKETLYRIFPAAMF